MADSTLFPAPSDVPDRLLVLMADIFPTGFFGARNAFKEFTPQQASEATVVVLGCGPVGLCALVNAFDYKPKNVFAVDAVDSRLALAKKLGAEPLNFKTDEEGLKKRVKDATGGRGADAVIEVVGLTPALRLAFDLVRPWGVISSIGVHNDTVKLAKCQHPSHLILTRLQIPWTAKEGYGKNLRFQQGRCPVRSIFPEALESLRKHHHQLE